MSHQAAILAYVHPTERAEALPAREGFSAEAMGFLNHVRLMSMTCRCSARAEVSQACRMLSMDPQISRDALVEALVKSLAQIMGRTPRFFSPGVATLSEDEMWLVRLVTCESTGDRLSAEFLIRSRVARNMRASMAFLARSLGDAFQIS
ncbi:MAG: hypothetical protein AAGK00_19155 [Pseudomonadota bacterium]